MRSSLVKRSPSSSRALTSQGASPCRGEPCLRTIRIPDRRGRTAPTPARDRGRARRHVARKDRVEARDRAAAGRGEEAGRTSAPRVAGAGLRGVARGQATALPATGPPPASPEYPRAHLPSLATASPGPSGLAIYLRQSAHPHVCALLVVVSSKQTSSTERSHRTNQGRCTGSLGKDGPGGAQGRLSGVRHAARGRRRPGRRGLLHRPT